MYNESQRSNHNLNSQTTVGIKSDDYGRNTNRPFKINQAVRHIGTGAKLIVIRYGREQVECRKPDLSSDYFYIYELEAWSEE